jgi:primosomal protein N' (replication factor Y) (superfamily II helicase)
MPPIARVEPLTRTRAFRGPFDYLVPSADGVEVGTLLRVPFAGRSVLGVVVATAQESELPLERLSQPEAVLGPGPPADLVELALWMADEYCSTPSRALGLVLAPGASAGVRQRERLVAELTAAGRALLNGSDGADDLRPRQRVLLEALREGPVIASDLGTPALRRLERRELVSLSLKSARRAPARHRVGSASAQAPELTRAQRDAVAAVSGGGEFLLHGVTGSGKTEVYLRAVADTLARGRSAIVLVPEIALTPQAMHRFESRFGDVVAVLHSGLGVGERYDEWQRLRSGEARVCVGPRSAVFAPLSDIGLIVVDEEHESSYKHEGDPRYDARAVAVRRASEHGALLLVGSATPRPESWSAYTRLSLPERVDGRPLPPVEILDMREQHHPLHPETRAALAEVRRARGKAIVLLNRRGWSNFLTCRTCGHVWMCPNCEVALVLHRAEGVVTCHHCGHRERVPERCGTCGSNAVARHGAGTERLEHELREALGGGSGFPVFRLDADVARGGAGVLEAFDAAPAGLLVGTQMVAKGHDFPEVVLGVVLDADQTLRFPDFRAEERTFALLTQLAGRAGRGDRGGRVLVQTLAPDARPILFAARHDSNGFVADELLRRGALGYPPFSSIIRIVCSAEDPSDAEAAARSLRAVLAPPEAAILGPAPLFALRGRARSQIVIKAFDRGAAVRAVAAAVDAFARGRRHKGVNVSVDVDPQ